MNDPTKKDTKTSVGRILSSLTLKRVNSNEANKRVSEKLEPTGESARVGRLHD